MPLRRIRYRTLRDLLRRELVDTEHPQTNDLMRRLRHVKRRGCFSRAEFLAMCKWKSPRAMRHYRKNTSATIRRISRAALATRSERQRLAILMTLKGVSVPMASAILTLIDPKRYGVIDIRVWQLLFAIHSVAKTPQGVGLRFNHWYQYLTQLRYHAKELGVPVRVVEHTLFRVHRKFQRGRLYDRALR